MSHTKYEVSRILLCSSRSTPHTLLISILYVEYLIWCSMVVVDHLFIYRSTTAVVVHTTAVHGVYSSSSSTKAAAPLTDSNVMKQQQPAPCHAERRKAMKRTRTAPACRVDHAQKLSVCVVSFIFACRSGSYNTAGTHDTAVYIYVHVTQHKHDDT